MKCSYAALFELSQQSEVGVSLYSRKVLIQQQAQAVMPKWLRFLRGVIDSEDIPLNLSRELLQNSMLIKSLVLLSFLNYCIFIILIMVVFYIFRLSILYILDWFNFKIDMLIYVHATFYFLPCWTEVIDLSWFIFHSSSKIKRTIIGRIIKYLQEQQIREPDKYKEFYADYGIYLREGVVASEEQSVRVRHISRFLIALHLRLTNYR